MHVPSSNIEARVSALEAYVDIPTEHNGTTVSGRLEAQHRLLLAIRGDYTEFRAEFKAFRAEFNAFRAEINAFRAEINGRVAGLEARLAEVEDMLGQVLYGMTEIKRLLTS